MLIGSSVHEVERLCVEQLSEFKQRNDCLVDREAWGTSFIVFSTLISIRRIF